MKQWLHLEVARPDDLVVLVDELDLPWGQIRIRRQGSSGGHHGLDSIIEATGTRRFIRIRIGIGSDDRQDDPIRYLLEPVAASMRLAYEGAVEEAAQATEMILREGVVKTMTRVNRRPQPETQPEP